MKAAGAGSVGKPSPWVPSGRTAAPVPAGPPHSPAEDALPRLRPNGEDAFADLNLLPPHADEELPGGASLVLDLDPLHLPPPPPQFLAEGSSAQSRPSHLRASEKELLHPPKEPVGSWRERFPQMSAPSSTGLFP
ncbi:putative filamin-binding LIM protein 1, incomplete match [Sciurus carolinensis]|uniref:Filamin-binding LIM protein 1, incomplete match n=1 Tax=Sciurus carolinensis TaxID=30640 RepID=A0AA41N7C9_SCICA|nr:putative filamin-binding LIM protein 1, incomplete match [Sciurus carolinensis]